MTRCRKGFSELMTLAKAAVAPKMAIKIEGNMNIVLKDNVRT